MAIGRSRYAPPVSTKGHSVLKSRSYGLSTRPPMPSFTPRSASYSSRAEEHMLTDRVSDVNYLSNALMDEGYDTALRSRGRDQALLKEATNAIPSRGYSTSTLSSSLPSMGGSRRYPRRFGRAGLRKNKSLSFYNKDGGEGATAGAVSSTSDLMSSPGPSSSSWLRFGSKSGGARSYLDDDAEDVGYGGSSSLRSSSVGPLPSSTSLAARLPASLSRTRRALSTLPSSSISETGRPWGQASSTSPSRLPLSLAPRTYSPFPEYEADDSSPSDSPILRRRQKVLSTSRRPAGNYYERLLKKRGKKGGRLGPYYDPESIEGSDLSGVFSDSPPDAGEYSGASLLLSVEGAGTSPEGKRVDFTYTPPPIPLYGRSVSLDNKVLGIRPASATIKPLDDFIAGYMERMTALRAALTGHLDRDREKRAQYGLKPLDTGLSSSSSYRSSYTPSYARSSRSYTPSYYTQSHDYVPVRHLSSERTERLPVTSFRKRQDDGHTERLDVFSLGEFRPRLSSSTTKAITIPDSATGGHQLSVLDKINIKAAIIASKMEPDPVKRRGPRSQYAANKYREIRREKMESPTSGGAASGGSSGVEGSGRPMSELRRRIRRTLNKSRVS